jgi:hypothetical protein
VWFEARNSTQPCILATSKPYPTIRSTCLKGPPDVYEPRADDFDAVASAHRLGVDEVALLCSFRADYIPAGVPRRLAARMLGNCVPPRQALRVCELALPYLSVPTEGGSAGVFAAKPADEQRRKSKIHSVLGDGGPGEIGATWINESPLTLEYLFGTRAETDRLYERVFGWSFQPGWRVVIKARSSGTRPDDLLVYTPLFRAPLRSKAQVLRLFGPAKRAEASPRPES